MEAAENEAVPPKKANKKSILMTPDPYHTPGYGGFCPQFKYQIGETFGRTTSRLLTNTNVASSGKLVLADVNPISEEEARNDPREALLKSRTQSWGDQKLVDKMIPGYTGFIPRSEHYFGNRYFVNSKNAISDFEFDHRHHINKMNELKLIEAIQRGQIEKPTDGKPPIVLSSHITPLPPIAKKPDTYISPYALQHSMSPYYMANDNPKKNFMSGYTGFVPRSRGRIGMGYPIITHNALNEFTEDIGRMKSIKEKPISVEREEKITGDGKEIYPVDSGLVPHYTGHIPGQKFRYGETFGFSTQNAMKHPFTELESSA